MGPIQDPNNKNVSCRSDCATQTGNARVRHAGPNFNLFNLFDGIAAGQDVPAGIVVRLTVLAGFYLAIYTMVSWFVFAKKEL